MAVDTMVIQDAKLTGYSLTDDYLALRYRQGGRTIYDVILPVAATTTMVARPDPAKPTEGNRRISASHAKGFEMYFRENTDEIIPALYFYALANNSFSFKEMSKPTTGVQIGILSIPKGSRELHILDGQHRVLGFYEAIEDIEAEIAKVQGFISGSRRDENAELEAQHQKTMNSLLSQKSRLMTEHVSVQIAVVNSIQEAQQAFADIAENAQGIKLAIRARFDTRKIVNRAIEDVVNHPLFKGHVDMEQDRVIGTNPNLIGVRHVADLVRIVEVGIAGRIGKAQEKTLDEGRLVENTEEFLNTLVAGFSELAEVADGKLNPADLRQKSLLGSATMLRVLGGVYHNLTDDTEYDASAFFEKLQPLMTAPVAADSIWMKSKEIEGVFTVGSLAPNARNQSIKALTNFITDMATKKEEKKDKKNVAA